VTRAEPLFESLRVARRFVPDLAGQRGPLVIAGALSLGAAAFEVLRPWPIQWIFDGALAPAGEARPIGFVIWAGAGAALAIALGRALLEYLGTLRTREVGLAVTRALRLRIFRHLSELPPSFHQRHKSGDLLVRLMGDVPIVEAMLVDSAVMVATRLAIVLGMVIVMLVLDPLLTLVALAMGPVTLVIVHSLSRRLATVVRKQRRKEGALANYLQEAIGATTLLQSLGGSGRAVSHFARSNRRTARAGLKAARVAARISGLVEATLGLSLAITLALGSLRVVAGHLSPGELIVFLSYVRSISKPVRSAAKHASKIAKGTACGERILHVLDEGGALRESSGDRPAPEHPRTLAFAGVHFTYDGANEALSGIDLELRRGELTALFGPSGAGKTTLTRLALRLLDPERGSVRLDGVDVRSFDLDALRTVFALSMQDTVLLGESIRENLLFAQPDASDEEMLAALAAAAALEFVDGTEAGLDAVLGAGGTGLSGGQRKRLCLARALLRDAPVLIVDEPFAGLDAQAAARVTQTLEVLARDKIVVVILHEVARLADFPRIVFLDDGRVAGIGTHAELGRTSARYREVCRSSPHLVA